MSSLLFNMVLQYSFKNEIQRWQKKKGMGIYLSDQERDCLTNLRLADDVMLFATSKEQIRKILCGFKEVTEKVGLRIHPDKTKILSNQSSINSDTKQHLEVDEMNVAILTRNESVKHLGQRISFHQRETLEIKSMMRDAWATFHKYRQVLTSKNYMLKHRLRLFDATVSFYLAHFVSGKSSVRAVFLFQAHLSQRECVGLMIKCARLDGRQVWKQGRQKCAGVQQCEGWIVDTLACHSFSDYLLRSGHVGTQQRTRKNDSIDATQDATTHYPDKKEIQKN